MCSHKDEDLANAEVVECTGWSYDVSKVVGHEGYVSEASSACSSPRSPVDDIGTPLCYVPVESTV